MIRKFKEKIRFIIKSDEVKKTDDEIYYSDNNHGITIRIKSKKFIKEEVIKIDLKDHKCFIENSDEKIKFEYGPIYFIIPSAYIDTVKSEWGYTNEDGLQIEYIEEYNQLAVFFTDKNMYFRFMIYAKI